MFKKIPFASNENKRKVDINHHQPPSPPTGVEQFFLPSLSTSDISAFHLAQTIRDNNNRASPRESNISEAVSDYHSCASASIDPEDNYQQEVLQGFEDVKKLTSSSTDKSEDEDEQPEEVLTVVSEESIGPSIETINTLENYSSLINQKEPTMPSKTKPTKTKPTTTKVDKPVTTEIKTKVDAPTKTETIPKVEPTPRVEIPIKPSKPESDNPAEAEGPTPTAPKTSTPVTPPKDDEPKTDDEPHIDVAQHVYGGIKNVWAFGSSIIVVKPFLKLTESVAGTVLGLSTGLKLENVDEGIKSKTAEIDNGLINPVIGKIVGMVLPIFKEGESIVKGVVPKVLGPFGFGAPVPTIAMGAPTETKEEKKPIMEKKEKDDEVDTQSSEETTCSDEAVDPRASTLRKLSSRLSHNRSKNVALLKKITRKGSIGETSTTTSTSAPPLSPRLSSRKTNNRDDQRRIFRSLFTGEGSTTTTVSPSSPSRRLSSSSRKTSPLFSRTISRTDSMGSLTTVSTADTQVCSLEDFSRSHESRLQVYMKDIEASIQSFDNVGGAKKDVSRDSRWTRRMLPSRELSRHRSASGAFPSQITSKGANDESSTTATTDDLSFPHRDRLSSSSSKTVDRDERRSLDNIASWVDGRFPLLKERRIKASERSKSDSGGSGNRKNLKASKLLDVFGGHQKMLMADRMTPPAREDEHHQTSEELPLPLIVAFPVEKQSSNRSSKSKR